MMTLSQMKTREKEIENRLNFLWDAKEIEPSIRFGEFNPLTREILFDSPYNILFK